MEDYIIIGIILCIIVLALLRVKKHFRGGCCSSGSNTIRDKKTLSAPQIGEKIMRIEGMHCENCAIRVENALNRLDGVLCRVNLKKKLATVSYSKEVADEVLKETVEKIGYTVASIQ